MSEIKSYLQISRLHASLISSISVNIAYVHEVSSYLMQQYSFPTFPFVYLRKCYCYNFH